MRSIAKKLTLAAAPLIVAGLLLGASPANAKGHHGHSHGQAQSKKKRPSKPVQDARKLFAAKKLPAALPTSSIGRIDNGCIAGAVQLPLDGPHWQVMRLSRNRYWGHPSMVDYTEKLADRAYKDGWPGILVGDMGMPRGGPMPSGHASHQRGLDVDLWLTPAPSKTLSAEEREKMGAPSVLKLDSAQLDTKVWTQAHADFVRDAAQDPNVQRIFVTPAIKQYLCTRKDPHGADTDWLRRLRPYEGHDDHIHVRLKCQKGDSACVEQDAPPPGDGCGAEVSDCM